MAFKISDLLKNRILPLFIIWSLWLSLEFLLGPFSHVRIFDSGDSLLPQLIASKLQFQKYGISYFAPYMVSGVDAMSQSLVPFSNLNSTIFILSPGWFAYELLMLVQRFLACYFTYRLSKDYLNLGNLQSIIAGLLFSLFNFSINSFTLYHALGLPALPLILWYLEKMNGGRNPRRHFYITIFGIFIGFSNYFVYFSPYLLPFILLWFIYVRNIYSKRFLVNFAVFSAASILPMLPNVFATIYNSQLSQRTAFNLSSATFSPQGKYLTAFYRVLDIIKSNYLSFVFIIFLSFKNKRKKLLSKKLLVIFMFITLMSFIYKLIQPHFYLLPNIIGSFSLDRFEFIIPFVLSLTVAVLLNEPSKKLKKIFTIFLVSIFIISVKVKVDTLKNYAPYRSLYLHPDLVALSKTVDSTKWRVATVTGGGVRPAYALSNSLYTVDAYLTLYPQPYHRFWADVIRGIISKEKSRYEDFIDWGNRVYLYGPSTFDTLNSIKFSDNYDLNLLSLANVKYIIAMKPIDDQQLILQPSVYRDQIGEWDKWSGTKKLQYFLSGKYFGRPVYVYENSRALPRFFLQTVKGISKEDIQIINYTPDKIKLEVNSTTNTQLVAAINYYPFWTFYVNGIKTTPKKYNGTFMSVDLKSGKEEIDLKYEPFYKIFY